MTILFDIAVDGGASQWYGVISITNIRHGNGTAVEIDRFLGLVAGPGPADRYQYAALELVGHHGGDREQPD